MNFVDYLSLDINDISNHDKMFRFIQEQMNEIKGSNFKADNSHIIYGMIDKFIEFAKVCEAYVEPYSIERANEFIEKLIETGSKADSNRIDNCMSSFEKLNSHLIIIYNRIVKNNFDLFQYQDFSLICNVNRSNKDKAISLIENAIEILKNDTILSKRKKEQIINQLQKIVENLKKEKPNWTFHFGKLTQSIILLGALGSFAGGVGTWYAIDKAREELINSFNVTHRTSINIFIENEQNQNVFFEQYDEEINKENINPEDIKKLPGKSDDTE